MKNILINKKGEGHVDTGIKIIIAVVIGAVLVGGFFAVQQLISARTEQKVQAMMHYSETPQMNILVNSNVNDLTYSYGEEAVLKPNIPSVCEGGNIYRAVNGKYQGKDAKMMIIKSDTTYYYLFSDNVIDWKIVRTVTRADTISLYYSASSGYFHSEIRIGKAGNPYYFKNGAWYNDPAGPIVYF